MTGFAVSSAPPESNSDAVHILMLILLVAGLLATFEFYRPNEEEPRKKYRVV
jgi:hypothetical protein